MASRYGLMNKPLMFNAEATWAAAAAAASGSDKENPAREAGFDRFRGHPGCLPGRRLLRQRALPVVAARRTPGYQRGEKSYG